MHILRYHFPPSWIACRTKTRLDGHLLTSQYGGRIGRDPFNQISNRSDREKWSTSKGGPVFSKLFPLDRTDPLSFGPKFPEILVQWIAPMSAAGSKSLKGIPYFDSSFIEKWLEKDGKVPKKVITRGYSNFCEGYIFDVEGKFQSPWFAFAPAEKLYENSGVIDNMYAVLGIIHCVFPSIMPWFDDRNPCDIIYSVLNFHIRPLLPVKAQDTEVLVRAKSYKSQRKNEEPWRLQVLLLPYCIVWAQISTATPSLVVLFAPLTLNLGTFYHSFCRWFNLAIKAIESFFWYKACVKWQQFRILGIIFSFKPGSFEIFHLFL